MEICHHVGFYASSVGLYRFDALISDAFFAIHFLSLQHTTKRVTFIDVSIIFHFVYRGIPYTYESGWKDWCAVFFYTLICIIMHAVLQEYVIDVSIKQTRSA